MDVIDERAERAILEAQKQGQFDDLPGAGKPLVLDDDRMVPESLRMAYRVLRNAGCAPPEVAMRSELAKAELELEQSLLLADRSRALRKLTLLRMRVAANRADRPLWVDDGDYRRRILRRLD